MRLKRNGKKRWRRSLLGLLVLGLILGFWQGRTLRLASYTVEAKELPDAFDGYTIVQISDLHDAYFGQGQRNLMALIDAAQPDAIVFTGDLVHGVEQGADNALCCIEQAVQRAPVFVVSGNHEGRADAVGYEAFCAQLAARGVHLLDDRKVIVERSGQQICLVGVHDPCFDAHGRADEDAPWEIMQRTLQTILQGESRYTVLLSHRPERLTLYAQQGVDLVLCGHTHGGQIRLPLVGALYVPNQGVFPPYAYGMYVQKDTQMIVSAGLGSSQVPVRFFCPPEVMQITLRCAP